MELKTQKCKCCNTLRKPSDFIYKEKNNKTCIKCCKKREKNKDYHKKYCIKYYQDNNEEHKKNCKKYSDKQKAINPLKVKLQDMIYNSKKADNKSERFYEEDDYITLDFLQGLYQSNMNCFYCKVLMSMTFNPKTKDKDQITIQRINNDLPHIKSNIVYSCFECNCNKRMEIDTYNKLLIMNNEIELTELMPIW